MLAESAPRPLLAVTLEFYQEATGAWQQVPVETFYTPGSELASAALPGAELALRWDAVGTVIGQSLASNHEPDRIVTAPPPPS